MRIVDYFALDGDQQARVRERLGESEWRASAFLKRQLEADTFLQRYGPGARLLLAVDGDELMGFCTLAERDDVQPTPLTPWIGFVYTFPAFRGHRLSGALIGHACDLARADGAPEVFLSTNETGLYEKYGFARYGAMQDAWGEDTQVYRRGLERDR